MKRIALIGDSHFDASSRFDECVRVHDWIANDIATRGVDLVLHSGDVFERKSNPDERRAVADWLCKVTEHAPVVIVRGNHDAPRDLSIFAKLETKHPIVVEEGAGVHVIGGCVVGCMAWPTKASVLALGAQSHAEGELLAGEALRNVLRGLGQEMEATAWNGSPKILLAHAMVRASRVSTGQPLVGCDLELGVEDLALAGADFVALGHIHMPQCFDPSGNVCRNENEGFLGNTARYVYPGSPRRTAFGELEQKGYVVAYFEERGVTWSRVPTPCTPMVHVHAEWVWENWNEEAEHRPRLVFDRGEYGLQDLVGAEVRLRYMVEADRRPEAKAAAEAIRAEWLEAGVLSVKLEEEVVSAGTARAPEVAAAATLPEKLYALWRARNTTPDEERAARLVGKAHQLEETARAL